MLKILHVPALLDWLAESFDLQVVRLLRHPAPQALSVVRMGWDFGTLAFYSRPEFLLGFLDEEEFEYGRRILAGSSRWQRAILDWCVHYRLLVHASRWPAPLVTYEALTLDPSAVCRALCDHLGLSDSERIAARIREPSTSPRGCSVENLALIRRGDSRSLIRSWQRQVDPTMAGQAKEILDRFNVTIYRMGSPLPDPQWVGIPGRSLEVAAER